MSQRKTSFTWFRKASVRIGLGMMLWVGVLQVGAMIVANRFVQNEFKPLDQVTQSFSDVNKKDTQVLSQRWNNFKSEFLFYLFIFSLGVVVLSALGASVVHYLLIARPLKQLIALNYRAVKDPQLYIDLEPTTQELAELFESRAKMLDTLEGYEKDLKKNLGDTQKELVQALQLCSIGELTASILHDINNPLSAILLNLSLLKEDIQSGNKKIALEKVSRLEIASDRIRKLSRRMLHFARSDIEMMDRIPLRAVIQNALEFVEMKIKKQGTVVQVDFPKQRMCCYGNPVALEQVFTNLFSNAIDAMEGSSTKKLFVSVKDHGDYFLVKVQDYGKGMKKEHLSIVFDAFFTTKPRGKGTGLGLSIVKQMVQYHHGEISVASEEGKGTTFSIQLWKENPSKKQTELKVA